MPVQVPFHGVFAKVGVLRNEVTRFTDYGGFDEDVVFFIAAIRCGSLISTIGAEAAGYSLGASICERTLPKDHVSAVYARPTKKEPPALLAELLMPMNLRCRLARPY